MHSRAGRLVPSVILGAIGLLFVTGPVAADDLFDYGAYLSSECTSCHRLDGGGDITIPPIIGWPEDIFIQTIDRYRRGVLTNAIMQNVARSLGEEETAALARFFSQQENGE